MKYYIEPYKVALLKKLILEKEDLEKQKYAAVWLFADNFPAFANADNFLSYLFQLQKDGFLEIPRYWFNSAYLSLYPYASKSWSNGTFPTGTVTFNKKLWKGIIGKIEKNEVLTLDEVLNIRGKFIAKDPKVFNAFLQLGFAFPKGTKMISVFLRKYIENYMAGELIGVGTAQYYNYGLQKQGFEKIIGDNAQIYGPKNLLVRWGEIWSNLQVTKPGEHEARGSQTRFWETLLAMELEGLLKVVQIVSYESARVSIQVPPTIPALNEWNSNFYSVASNMSYFNFINKRREQSKKRGADDFTTLQWEDFSLNLGTGQAEYGGKKHHFMPGGSHFKIIKRLLEESGGEVTYEKFFRCLGGDMEKDPKVSRVFVRQKIRNIRKYFGINRKKNPERDIFIETGNGFKLGKITTEPEIITKQSQTPS